MSQFLSVALVYVLKIIPLPDELFKEVGFLQPGIVLSCEALGDILEPSDSASQVGVPDVSCILHLQRKWRVLPVDFRLYGKNSLLKIPVVEVWKSAQS